MQIGEEWIDIMCQVYSVSHSLGMGMLALHQDLPRYWMYRLSILINGATELKLLYCVLFVKPEGRSIADHPRMRYLKFGVSRVARDGARSRNKTIATNIFGHITSLNRAYARNYIRACFFNETLLGGTMEGIPCFYRYSLEN